MNLRLVAWTAAAFVLLVCRIGQAHDVIVEQRVDVAIHPSGDRLMVQLHVPINALAEAKLPVLPNGALDEEHIAQSLDVVGADVARNFDLWHNGAAFPPSHIAAHVGADRRSVDVELAYATAATNGFSARLNAFTGTPLQPVRTIAQYVPVSGDPQIASVAGPARRVAFDPGTAEAVSQVAARALTAVLSLGDHVLWLLCVLLPVRRARPAATLVVALIAGQLVAIIGSALTPHEIGPVGAFASLVAASALVMAALQTIVGARERWVLVLTAMFGVLSGCTFGGLLVDIGPFAGSHQPAAFVMFPLVVALGELWIAAVAWGVRTWLASAGIGDGVTTIVASVLIAHTAIHRMLDRGQRLVQSGVVNSMRVVTWLTLGWAAAMGVIALVELLRQRGATARARPSSPQRA